MKTYARIDCGKVLEIFHTNKEIKDLFHSDIEWVECGQDICEGSEYVDGLFIKATTNSIPLSESEIENLRLLAYADPLNGSDKYFAEALALQAEGFTASSSEVKELKQKGLARKEEIKLAYPKP